MTSKLPMTPDKKLGAGTFFKDPTQLRKNADNSAEVKVVCRFRPMNQKEEETYNSVCVEFLDDQTVLYKGKEDEKAAKAKVASPPLSFSSRLKADSSNPNSNKYTLDRIFPMATRQKEIYEFAARPVVDSVLEGFNGTIFAYGQTSSGKTHTMQGVIENEEQKGIVPRMVSHVFNMIENSPDHIEFRIKVSIVEIYMEKIRDLLDVSKANLKIREDKTRGVYIQDVTEKYVSEETEVYELMRVGANNRAISATNMNEVSSRSHSLFFMTITQNNLNDLSAKTGKLVLVDLAGSEKVGKTGAAGQLLEEAKKINKSLSSLGNVINALTDGKSIHIPYRDAKLTRVLQESLGGNSKTTLIVTCSPSSFNESETLSTLKFGCRAKSIKNKPKINREMTVAELQKEIQKKDKIIEEQSIRINQLEEYIKGLGKDVPPKELVPINVIVEEEREGQDPKEKGDSDDEEDDEPSKLNPQAISVSNILLSKQEADSLRETNEKIEILERELETQIQNVKAETEKYNNLRRDYAKLKGTFVTYEKDIETLRKERDEAIKELRILGDKDTENQNQNVKALNEKLQILRKEFALLHSKIVTKEKENESYVTRLAQITVTLQDKNELLKDQEEKIAELEGLNQSLQSEIEEIQKSKQHLLEVIKEKNKEIENHATIIEQYKLSRQGFGMEGRPSTSSAMGSPSKSSIASKTSSPGYERKSSKQSLNELGEDSGATGSSRVEENPIGLLREMNERSDQLILEIKRISPQSELANELVNEIAKEAVAQAKIMSTSYNQPFVKGSLTEEQREKIFTLFEINNKKQSNILKLANERNSPQVMSMIEKHSLDNSKKKELVQRLLGTEIYNQKPPQTSTTPVRARAPLEEKDLESLVEMNKRKDVLLSKIFSLEKNNPKLNKLLEENSSDSVNLNQELRNLYANPPEYLVKGLGENFSPDRDDKSSLQDNYSGDSEAKRVKDVERELRKEREKNEKLKKDITYFKVNYEKMLVREIPQMEDIKKTITKDVQEIEKKKFDKEKATILKDLQNRVNKVVALEMEIDDYKTQISNMENFMSQGEKALKKKVNSLESNLEQLTLMYHQLLSQRSHLKVDNQVIEKKLKRKNDKIFQLEKELNETKSQLSSFKSKYEHLMATYGYNEVGAHLFSGSMLTTDLNYFNLDNTVLGEEESNRSIFDASNSSILEKNSTREQRDSNPPSRISLSNPSRIVKTIKGGRTSSSKTGIATTDSKTGFAATDSKKTK